MKRRFYGFHIIALLYLFILFPSCVYYRAIASHGPKVGDMNRYPLCELPPALAIEQIPVEVHLDTCYSLFGKDFFEKTKTRAFLIMKNDTIRFSYFEQGVESKEQTDLFSITKSVLSALVGIAIEEHFISSLEDSVSLYLGNRYPQFSNIRIIDLMDMRAGIGENFNMLIRLYYGRNLSALLRNVKKNSALEGYYLYSNASAQLLTEVLEVATGVSVITYFREKLWNKMGMQYKGSWSYDSSRSLKARGFCGLNMSPLDLLKFGRLYLYEGKYNGQQLISEKWIDFTRTIRNKNINPKDGHDYNVMWRNISDHEIFAKGLLGQYLYVNWEKQLIIVRLGYKEGKTDWIKIFQMLAVI